MDLLMFRKRGKQLDYTRQSYCFFVKIHQAIGLHSYWNVIAHPPCAENLKTLAIPDFFRQGFAIRETAAQLSNVGSVCDPPRGHAEIKTLMLYAEGLVPWYKAFRSPHRCDQFFPILGAVFPVHENKNNRFKFSSLQSSSAGESCRWVTMFGY